MGRGPRMQDEFDRFNQLGAHRIDFILRLRKGAEENRENQQRPWHLSSADEPMNVPQFPYESDRASDDYYDALLRITRDPRVAHFLSSSVLRYVIDSSATLLTERTANGNVRFELRKAILARPPFCGGAAAPSKVKKNVHLDPEEPSAKNDLFRVVRFLRDTRRWTVPVCHYALTMVWCRC